MESTKRTNLWMWSALVLAVLCLSVTWKYSVLRLKVDFAWGQEKVFEGIKESALESTNPFKLTQFLHYVVDYYPSGERQTKGSALDQMVEVDRAQTIKTIIDRLRIVTGRDLGNSPEKWLLEYPPLK
jgi:hypothetical protein